MFYASSEVEYSIINHDNVLFIPWWVIEKIKILVNIDTGK